MKTRLFTRLLCTAGLILLPLGNAFSQANGQAIDTKKLQELARFCEDSGADKFSLYHQGSQIFRWDATDCDSVFMNTASMVKSWTGLMIGILIDEGRIRSVEDKVCQYLPEWTSGCENGVTIRHLLTMSSGLLKKRTPESVLAQDNMNAFVLQMKLDTLPGSTFSYSNEGVQLLGILIERVCGKTANACFNEKLFAPLDMDSTRLFKDKAGNDVVYGGCQTTLEDAAQIGLLVSKKGKYKDRQIVSAQWIDDSFIASPKASFYGYLWWLDPNSNSVAAMGDFGQMTIYFPDLDLIFVRQQSCNNRDRTKNLNWMGPDFLKLLRSIVNEG